MPTPALAKHSNRIAKRFGKCKTPLKAAHVRAHRSTVLTWILGALLSRLEKKELVLFRPRTSGDLCSLSHRQTPEKV